LSRIADPTRSPLCSGLSLRRWVLLARRTQQQPRTIRRGPQPFS
jgi:hypothetical protein